MGLPAGQYCHAALNPFIYSHIDLGIRRQQYVYAAAEFDETHLFALSYAASNFQVIDDTASQGSRDLFYQYFIIPAAQDHGMALIVCR